MSQVVSRHLPEPGPSLGGFVAHFMLQPFTVGEKLVTSVYAELELFGQEATRFIPDPLFELRPPQPRRAANEVRLRARKRTALQLYRASSVDSRRWSAVRR